MKVTDVHLIYHIFGPIKHKDRFKDYVTQILRNRISDDWVREEIFNPCFCPYLGMPAFKAGEKPSLVALDGDVMDI